MAAKVDSPLLPLVYCLYLYYIKLPEKLAITNPFIRKDAIDDDYIERQLSLETIRRDSLTFNPSRLFANFLLFNNTPQWQQLTNMQGIFDWYHSNPIFYTTVMIKAREYSNMKIKVVNKNSGVVEPEKTQKPTPRKLYKLFNKPNVMQSRWEFMKQRKILHEVGGNSFTYGNFTIGTQNAVENLAALWNVWPANMQFKLTGKYFEATKIEDVVKEWKFEVGPYKKVWTPYEILHRNEPNTDINNGIIFGRSAAQSMIKPLTNIDMAYEARNVIMKNRGMRVILTSDRGDASGKIPLLDDEVAATEKAIKKYGILEGQQQFMFSNMPLKVTVVDQDVMKLGLFEEIYSDAMMICNAFGVPEILLKLYIKGATFENVEASVRRLYQGTLIPESIDDMLATGSFLGLDDEDWMIMSSFDHVSVLQESEEKKETIRKQKADRLLAELAKGMITPDEYRLETARDPIPPKPTGEIVVDTRTLEAQAALRGSVGGVTSILAVQAGVSAGTTTYDSGIAILMIVFGFTQQEATALLGEPKVIEEPPQTDNSTNQNTTDENNQDQSGNN